MRNLRWEVWDLPRYGAKACEIPERAYTKAVRGRRIARRPVDRVANGIILMLNAWTMAP